MSHDTEQESGGGFDRHKAYFYGVIAGILVALIGVWLTPVAAEIGRREIGVLYGVGWFALTAGSTVALLCVVLIVVDS